MAVTVHTQPSAFSPAYNPNWWVASSTQSGQPNFTYQVTFSDVISGSSLTKNISKRPSDSKVIIDSSTFAQPFVTQLNPDSLYGFQKNTGALRKIRVNIGERYDVAGVSTFFNGTNIDYYVWNGSLPFLEYQAYSQTNYLWNYYLTNNQNPLYDITDPTKGNWSYDEKTFLNKSNYLSCLSAADGEFDSIQIKGYSSAGALLSTTNITSPYLPTSDYTQGYVFIDVGYKGLLNMPAGQVTSGTYPIPVSTFGYYKVIDTSTNNPPAAERVIKTIYVDCEPRYDVISLHYLAAKGQFESFHFSKLSERTSDVKTTTYSKYPYELSGNNVIYYQGTNVEVTLSSTETNKIKVNSDWLTENEVTRLKELSKSPLIYMDRASGTRYTAMRRVNNSYFEKKKYNEKLISVSFELEYTHTNTSQRG